MNIPAATGPSLRSGKTLQWPEENPVDGEPSAPQVTDKVTSSLPISTRRKPISLTPSYEATTRTEIRDAMERLTCKERDAERQEKTEGIIKANEETAGHGVKNESPYPNHSDDPKTSPPNSTNI